MREPSRTGPDRAATKVLRPRPTFPLAARHNQCRTDSACRTDFGGGKSVVPPWRARRSHFSRVRASSLFGTAGVARTGARPTEPPGQPSAMHDASLGRPLWEEEGPLRCWAQVDLG